MHPPPVSAPVVASRENHDTPLEPGAATYADLPSGESASDVAPRSESARVHKPSEPIRPSPPVAVTHARKVRAPSAPRANVATPLEPVSAPPEETT